MNAETKFQKDIKDAIKDRFPDSIILKQNNGPQGIPDLFIINNNKWAALECKDAEDAKHQPNQDYYIDKLNKMSYAAFIFPENKTEVLNEVFKALEP